MHNSAPNTGQREHSVLGATLLGTGGGGDPYIAKLMGQHQYGLGPSCPRHPPGTRPVTPARLGPATLLAGRCPMGLLASNLSPKSLRDLWQGLAQICVGLTHAARGNSIGLSGLSSGVQPGSNSTTPATGRPTGST